MPILCAGAAPTGASFHEKQHPGLYCTTEIGFMNGRHLYLVSSVITWCNLRRPVSIVVCFRCFRQLCFRVALCRTSLSYVSTWIVLLSVDRRWSYQLAVFRGLWEIPYSHRGFSIQTRG